MIGYGEGEESDDRHRLGMRLKKGGRMGRYLGI